MKYVTANILRVRNHKPKLVMKGFDSQTEVVDHINMCARNICLHDLEVFDTIEGSVITESMKTLAKSRFNATRSNLISKLTPVLTWEEMQFIVNHPGQLPSLIQEVQDTLASNTLCASCDGRGCVTCQETQG